MKLNSEFYRLPLSFDVERLISEVNSFNESDWIPHPSGYEGNTSIPLISVNGEVNDTFIGRMQATPQLEKCPYIKQVIASFDEVFGRSRLMRLAGEHSVPEHSDINYHWYTRVRIHIPIITFPDVTFYCGDANVHMGAGEVWIFDSWKMHRVENNNAATRTHLVIDTSGSSKFWEMVEHSDQPHKNIIGDTARKKHIPFVENKKCTIQTENYNAPMIMLPGEMDALCLDIINDAASNHENRSNAIDILTSLINSFRYDWRRIWLVYGSDEEGWPYYRELLNTTAPNIAKLKGIPLSSNRADAAQIFYSRIVTSCFNPSIAKSSAKKKRFGFLR